MISAFIVLLHLPLIYYTSTLYAGLTPAQGIGDLAPSALLVLIVLFALPYTVLAISKIPWNPERARLNEIDG
jgi:hypothetical protein